MENHMLRAQERDRLPKRPRTRLIRVLTFSVLFFAGGAMSALGGDTLLGVADNPASVPCATQSADLCVDGVGNTDGAPPDEMDTDGAPLTSGDGLGASPEPAPTTTGVMEESPADTFPPEGGDSAAVPDPAPAPDLGSPDAEPTAPAGATETTPQRLLDGA